MEIGILLPTREAVMSGRFDAGPMLEFAERAEAAGFASIWVGDSLLARPRFEPLTLLAAVAACTRKARLGTAVLLAALRHPLLLAHQVATLDRIAEGRLILGVGIGFKSAATRNEFEAVGAPFDKRAGRLRELVHLCRSLWRDDAVSAKGRYWSLENVRLLPTPHRQGGPPIWVGGSGETSLRLAAELGDGWFPISPTPEAFCAGWRRIQDAARDASRATSITPALYTTVSLDEDPRAAETALRQFIEAYYGLPFETIAAMQGCYAGTGEDCAEWLRGFAKAGVEHIVLRFAGRDQISQLERAAQGLLPRVATT